MQFLISVFYFHFHFHFIATLVISMVEGWSVPDSFINSVKIMGIQLLSCTNQSLNMIIYEWLFTFTVKDGHTAP